MKSNMPAQKDFAQAQISGTQRSVFNRSHGHKSTFNQGELIPFYADEIIPGDSQDLKANIFARLSSALEFPIMDNIHLDTFFFFIPLRILWDNFEKFMGERENPDDSIDYLIPQVTTTGTEVNSLLDHLGIPLGVEASISSLFCRAYTRCWHDWFRDQNLQDSITQYTGDGPESEGHYGILPRGKRFDYFTSCLPYPQKTPAGVGIGLAGTAPVIGNGQPMGLDDGTAIFGLYRNSDSDGLSGNSNNKGPNFSPGDTIVGGSQIEDEVSIGLSGNAIDSGIIANLEGSTAILINDLRLAVATQQFLELNMRAGTRYIDLVKANFGVTVPDYRLQRTEYLGGSTQMMNVNPVTQTSESGDTPQGNQTAHVTASSRSGYSKSFSEHGIVLGLVNVRADLTYQQGIHRMFTRKERLDFYFPIFANLGEQAVLNSEIFHQGLPIDDEVFGYNERWAEMRYKPSQITGVFRSDAPQTLENYHLAEDFANLPVLGAEFIISNPPLQRTMVVTDQPAIIFDSYIQLRHARPMPTFSTPGLERL